jgi:hypothetical protein
MAIDKAVMNSPHKAGDSDREFAAGRPHRQQHDENCDRHHRRRRHRNTEICQS